MKDNKKSTFISPEEFKAMGGVILHRKLKSGRRKYASYQLSAIQQAQLNQSVLGGINLMNIFE